MTAAYRPPAELPSVEIVRASASSTRWRVRFAASGSTEAREYFATTYPKSAIMMLETVNGRRVSKWTGTKIVPLAREAIAAAQAQAQEVATCAS